MDPAVSLQPCRAISAVRYFYPILTLIYFWVAAIVSVFTLQDMKAKAKNQLIRRDVLLSLMVCIFGSYLIEVATIGIFDAIHRSWSTSQDYNIYVFSSILVWGLITLTLAEAQSPVWYPYLGCWFIGTASESFLVITQNIAQPPKIWFEFVSIVLQVLRICALGLLLCLYMELHTRNEDEDPERQSLLRKKFRPGYGAAADPNPRVANADDDNSDASSAKRKSREKRDARLANEGNWFTYIKGFSIFFPLVWPVHNKKLQAQAVGVVGCLLFENVMHLLTPIQFGIMGSAILGSNNSTQGPWFAVGLYCFLFLLNTGSFVNYVQDQLWLPIELYARETISTASYKHVMNLSSDFHDSKSTSEVRQVLQQGQSVKDLVEMVCFKILPKVIDLSAAFIYLYFLFGPYMLLAAFAEVVVYLSTTTRMLNSMRPLRRLYLKTWKKEHVVQSQGLSSWQNAVYFNRIPYENERYNVAIDDLNKADYQYSSSWHASTVIQGTLLALGFTLAMYIGLYQVVVLKTKSLGDFITLVSLWGSLHGPLYFFNGMYKNVSTKLLDAEELLELFQTKPSVIDTPNAKQLEFSRGSVTFHEVNFSYDERKESLTNVSFHVKGGSTVALVGETGGGKSTILKLLSRFYDVKDGRIEIDGQDIREVTLASLRECIGAVPQDPCLFNDTIMNNIRYARLDASVEEVHEACKAAAVHDQIMGFPDGYESKVGDKGVKLSGGEKQRVAIARAILKNPKMVVLDEATSAVDTETEAKIQAALAILSTGRTTFVVAHRLSTVMRADRIIVIKEGTIIEEGSHEDLIKKRGKYYDLWSKQVFLSPEDPEQPQSSSEPLVDISNDVVEPLIDVSKDVAPSPGPAAIQIGEASNTTKPMQDENLAKNQSSEGRKLKPDAPEFVPRNVITSLDGANDSSDSQKDKSRGPDTERRKAYSSVARKASKKADKRVSGAFESSGDEPQSTAQPSGNESKEDEGNVSSSNANPKTTKRSRSSRRRQSKSEPTAQATTTQAKDSIRRTMDGTQETEYTGSGSGDGSLPLSPAPERRFSAPSDPPSGTLRDMRGASRGGRARRPRHWRLRKHLQDPALSMSASRSSSGSASAEYAAAAGVVAPVSTPALLPTPRIRFAPGC